MKIILVLKESEKLENIQVKKIILDMESLYSDY